MPYDKGDFTEQGINGAVTALVRLNDKRVVKMALSSDDESDNCDISGKVYDLLNGTSYDIGSGGGGGGTLITFIDTTFEATSTEHNYYEGEIFSETGIPSSDDGFISPIYVTYDGVDYTLEYDPDFGYYGATWDYNLGGFDFSEYPFNIYPSASDDPDGQYIQMSTETSGEHTIVIKGSPTPTPTVEPFEKVIFAQQLITPTLQNGAYQYSLPRGESLSLSYNNENAIVYYENNEYSCPITYDSGKYVYVCGDPTFSSYPFYIEEDADRHYNTAFFEDDTAVLFGLSIYVITCSGSLAITKNGNHRCSGFELANVTVYSELTNITINRTDSINQNVSFEMGVEINKINYANDVQWYSQKTINPNSTKTFGFPKVGNDPYFVIFTHPYNTNLTITINNNTIHQTTFDNNYKNCTVGFVPLAYITTIYIALSV